VVKHTRPYRWPRACKWGRHLLQKLGVMKNEIFVGGRTVRKGSRRRVSTGKIWRRPKPSQYGGGKKKWMLRSKHPVEIRQHRGTKTSSQTQPRLRKIGFSYQTRSRDEAQKKSKASCLRSISAVGKLSDLLAGKGDLTYWRIEQ